MSRSTTEHVSDGADLPALDPRWFVPDSPDEDACPDTEGPSVSAPPAAPTRGRTTRRLAVVGLVITAIVAGSAGTRWFDQRTRTHSPPWLAPCQQAIDATAQLHRLQAVQLGRAMQGAWAAVAGVHVQPTPVDTSENARLQRDADDAVAQCLSPAASQT